MRQLLLTFLIGFSGIAQSQLSVQERCKHFNTENKIALQGYDPVAYFTLYKPVKGKSSYQLNQQGIIYYFSSNANKKLFIENPNKFEPQYGGWCAFAMGDNGEKVEIDPETFKITDGKLYVFYNGYFNNTLKSWNKDEKKLKIKADKNWSKITTKP